jgi:undecaprenyl diphosphate synthase
MTTQGRIPKHIAIVMDGNGRWATRRFLPRVAGHKAGVDSLRRCVRACAARAVPVLTVFAFSSENWNRPQDEVSGLMDLLVMALSREVPQLVKDGVRLHFVGDRSNLSSTVRSGLEAGEQATAGNTALVLNVCFNYGGRWDIAQAARHLAAAGSPITEESLARAMAISHVPTRTSSSVPAVSSASATSSCGKPPIPSCISPTFCGPSFDEAALDKAIAEFASASGDSARPRPSWSQTPIAQQVA